MDAFQPKLRPWKIGLAGQRPYKSNTEAAQAEAGQ